MTHSQTGRCLGLIGGLGVGAAIHYYRGLAEAHEARGSELRLLMAHAHMPRAVGYVRAGDRAGLAEYLAGLIRQLEAGGAQVAAIPAVTPHICIRELAELSPLPLVNMLAVTGREVQARGIRRAALFGTRYTMETGLFGCLGPVELVTPQPREVQYIHDTYMKLAESGRGSADDRRGLTDLAHTLCERDGAEAIILAGTDLALIFDEDNTDFPHFDCARAHMTAIMRSLLDGETANHAEKQH